MRRRYSRSRVRVTRRRRAAPRRRRIGIRL